jgi:DNA-binding Lrp family transcriptional regulator
MCSCDGRFDLRVKIYARNIQHLRDILYEQIQLINGVEETNTVVSFETSFNRNGSIPKQRKYYEKIYMKESNVLP